HDGSSGTNAIEERNKSDDTLTDRNKLETCAGTVSAPQVEIATGFLDQFQNASAVVLDSTSADPISVCTVESDSDIVNSNICSNIGEVLQKDSPENNVAVVGGPSDLIGLKTETTAAGGVNLMGLETDAAVVG